MVVNTFNISSHTRHSICAITSSLSLYRCTGYVLNIFGEWRGKAAAGPGRTLRERLRNPRFSFTVPRKGKKNVFDYLMCEFQLCQYQFRLCSVLCTCMFCVFSLTPSSDKIVFIFREQVIDTMSIVGFPWHAINPVTEPDQPILQSPRTRTSIDFLKVVPILPRSPHGSTFNP